MNEEEIRINGESGLDIDEIFSPAAGDARNLHEKLGEAGPWIAARVGGGKHRRFGVRKTGVERAEGKARELGVDGSAKFMCLVGKGRRHDLLDFLDVISSEAAKHETATRRTSSDAAAASTAKCESTGAAAEAAVHLLVCANCLAGLLLLRGSRPFAKVFVGRSRVDHGLAVLHHVVAAVTTGSR